MITIRYCIVLLFAAVLLHCSGKQPSALHKAEALQMFDSFQTQLLSTLNATIDREGFSAAIAKCKTASPEMEKQSSTQGWTIRRVSDRPRNPNHTPDEFESRVLARWLSEMKSGRKPEPVAEIEGENLRVMRPIVIQAGLCMRCHGTQETMDSAAAHEIERQYPADKATGYSMGDLRGAFSALRKAE